MGADTAPDAIAMLKQEHREVEDLFAKFENAGGTARKKEIARTICKELVIHSMIEEEIFYPCFRRRIEDDLLDEAYVEHDGAKVLIAEIDAMDPDDDFFEAKVLVLKEQIEHHVKEEEKPGEGVFFEARETGEDMDALADRMRARREELEAEIDEKGLPTPETRSFVGAEVETGEPVEN